MVGCTTFGTDDPAAEPPPSGIDASTPDAGDGGGGGGGGRASDPGGDAPAMCTLTEKIAVARDAIMATSLQNLSDGKVCNLSVGDCLVAFDRLASKGKRVVALQLALPRATDPVACGQPCTQLHGAGSIAVSHMRSDWTNDAYGKARNGAGALWGANGAASAADVSATPLAVKGVLDAEPAATLALDPTKLDTAWAADPAIALRIRAIDHFQFLLQRARTGTPPLAELTVTYCP